MNGVLEHPARERLNAFSLGQLEEAELAAIEDHLEHCGACREAAASAADDTLIALLRSAATEPNSNPAEPCRAPATQTEAGAGAPTASGLMVPPALAEHPPYRWLARLGA